MNYSESIPTKKFFSKNFRFFGQNFFEKMAKSQKKIFNGKKFSKSILSFWNTFWTILNRFRPKKFFRKFFDFLVTNFSKKRLCPRKKNSTGKNFQNRNFHFKIRFEPFWIDSEQKNFFEKISKIFDFLVIFGVKNHVFAIFQFF